MDVLADVLARSRISGTAARAELTSPWGFEVPARAEATFLSVARGECHLRMEAEHRWLRLAQGDLVLLPRGLAHSVAELPGRRLVSLPRVMSDPAHFRDGLLVYGGTGDRDRTPPGSRVLLLWGAYCFEHERANPLLSLLPPRIHVPAAELAAEPTMVSSLQLLAGELAGTRPGRAAISARMVDVIFVQLVRQWAAGQPQGATGWLGALGDARLAAALSRIHAEPALEWTVATLAREAAMSRAAFARRFMELVGQSPVAYLTRWRISLAAQLLEDTDLGLAEISGRVGYRSEFALSKAFRRVRGLPPATFRSQKRVQRRPVTARGASPAARTSLEPAR